MYAVPVFRWSGGFPVILNLFQDPGSSLVRSRPPRIAGLNGTARLPGLFKGTRKTGTAYVFHRALPAGEKCMLSRFFAGSCAATGRAAWLDF
jgi:hypothetical protein